MLGWPHKGFSIVSELETKVNKCEEACFIMKSKLPGFRAWFCTAEPHQAITTQVHRTLGVFSMSHAGCTAGVAIGPKGLIVGGTICYGENL